MKVEDVSQNPRIAGLWQLARQLRLSTSPADSLRVIQEALYDAYGPLGSIMLATRGLEAGEFQILEFNVNSAGARNKDLPCPETVNRGGVIARLIDRNEPRLFQDVDWSTDPIFSQLLAGYESIAAIPLASQRLSMTWIILVKQKPQRLTAKDVEESMLRSALVGSLLESQTLVGDLEQANSRIDREIKQTGDLQRLLLPNPLPQIPGLLLDVSYQPSGKAGGDLYDLFRLKGSGPERWCILIADASGHGLVAAVVTAMVHSIIHAYPPDIQSPAELLSHLNGHLCQNRILGFVTAFVGIYVPSTRQFTYAAAGHPPPLIRRDGKDVVRELDAASNVPLAIESDSRFSESVVQLQSGDVMLMYTDGITEARSPEGELFDLPRLVTAMQESSARPADLIRQVLQRVAQHEQGRNAIDDQTMLAIQVTR